LLTAKHLGGQIKALRAERKMTLEEMSRICGVSISTLSKIENAQASPGYITLKKIADGLNVSFERLVNDKRGLSDLARRVVTRKNDIVSVQSDRYDLAIYAVDLVPKAMVPLVMQVKTRAPPAAEDLHSHEGEEFILLLSGRVELYLEHYGPLRLKPGEGVYIDSRMKHGFANVGKGNASLLSIYYDPQREMQTPKDAAKLLKR